MNSNTSPDVIHSDSIMPDRIININVDGDGYMIAAATAWEVETPTGTELAPPGWDEDETIVMSQAELKRLLNDHRPTLKAMCAISQRNGSRPEMVLHLKQE